MTEQDPAAFERFERIGKCLFGVAACIVVLRRPDQISSAERPAEEAVAAVHDAAQADIRRFCEQLPVTKELVVTPATTTSAPGQPPLGMAGNLSIRFHAVQPVLDQHQQVLGSVCLIHDRPRACTSADRELLADLAVLVVRELHLQSMLMLQAGRQEN